MEPVIHQELKEKLEEVLDGAKDVVIIPQLFKSMTYTYVDVVLEKWQFNVVERRSPSEKVESLKYKADLTVSYFGELISR